MYFKDASKKKEKKKEHNVQFPPWVFIYICDFFLFVICDWMKKKIKLRLKLLNNFHLIIL